MSDDEIREIKSQLNRIERCLTGDAEMGQAGLVTRVNLHEVRLSKLERAGIYIAGAAGLASSAWAVWTQWPR